MMHLMQPMQQRRTFIYQALLWPMLPQVIYFHAIFFWLITNLLLFKGLEGTPPWFQPAMDALLAPIRAEITQLRNELRTDNNSPGTLILLF
jgi:hypothetical protein